MRKILSLLSVCFLCSWVYAQEPANQPTNFVATSIKAYGHNISFSGSGSNGYLVVRSIAPLSAVPVDGTVYTKGGGLGNGKIFSSSGASFAAIKECKAGTLYYFTIFAYNGSGASIDYRQTDPLIGTVFTTDNNIGNYYQGIDQNAAGFINDLHTRLQTGKITVSYSLYDNNIVPAVFERDTVGNKKVVQCAYSNEVKQYTAPFTFAAINYSREHCLAQSWMPSGGNTSDPEGCDYHNLLLTNQNDANAMRSNYPFGEVVSVSDSYLACKLGNNAGGDLVFEPAENIKGDVARSIFYQMVSWNGLSGNWGISNLATNGPDQDVNVLLTWHQNDPPDGAEKAKTEYIYSIQNNRNPFIDYPEWTDCINFNNLTRINGCFTTIGTENEPDWSFEIYPNPTSDRVFINASYIPENTVVTLVDLQGKVIKTIKFNQQLTNHTFTIELSDVNCGVFLMKAESEKQLFIKKIIIQK